MYSCFQRINAISAFATSVLLCLLVALSATTFIIPANFEKASLKINSLNVVNGRSAYERREQPFASVRFDLKVDLQPLFNWNTKQVFVYFVAEYSTGNYPENQVVLWDRIIRRRSDARINIADAKNKYAFTEITETFTNVTATFSLQYNVMPHVGILTFGEVGRTESMKFTAPRGQSS